ncbi:MAG: glycosyltransferase family 4 protein [Terriglobia bacterium]
MISAGPLKIAHIDTGLRLRGGQRQLLQLARRLRQRGHCQIIVCQEESELERRARAEEFSRFALPLHDPKHAYGILQLRQHLRDAPCDILHAHDGQGQTVAWLASIGMPIRRIANRGVTFLPTPRWTHRLKYTHTCDAVVAASDFIRQLLIRAEVPESKIELIPDGIEIPLELPSMAARTEARAHWGFGEDEFLAGHLGAFTPEKGQDIALEAFRLLVKRLPKARLLLAGKGPTLKTPAMTRLLDELGDAVRLCGEIENLAEFFPALDLFVMPSKSEGLGSSAIMAMSYGLAVVASRVGGLPEIVEEARTGWLVEPASPSALAEAITSAAGNPARLKQFGLKGRERARQFSFDIKVVRTEALYRRLLCG